MKKQLKTYFKKLIGSQLNLLYNFAPQKAAKESLKLFVTPRKGKINPEEIEILNRAEKERVEVNGLALQTYLWKGGNQKVLLIHGWESNTVRWEELIICLEAENYTVISLDAPAHGNSAGKEFNVPVYAEALSVLATKYQPQFAVGHSVGGATLLFQQYQQALPGLQKMILLAPASEMTKMMNDFQSQLGLKTRLMETLETVFEEKFGYNFSDFSMLKFTKDFKVDALFIHDKEDKIIDWKDSLAIVRQWENARLILTKGFGHSIKRESVRTAILQFLKEHKTAYFGKEQTYTH